MQEKTTDFILNPTIDLAYYTNLITHFVISHFPQFVLDFKDILGYVVALALLVSFVFLLGIVFAVESLKAIRRKESIVYDAKIEAGYEDAKKGDPELTNKWNRIIAQIESDNENDWRQAIIEADVILADILTKLGYRGDGVGEQLRRVVKGDFMTLDQAGEAHGVRNRIAHSGGEFIIDQYEARRVINLYKQVFEEFYFI